MKATSLNSMFYNPGDPGEISNIADLVRFIRDENLKVANALRTLADGHLDPLPAAPLKPRDGDWRIADGVNWNPLGMGKGPVWYDGATNSWKPF